jgi:phosphoenolpyruvate synthase/pyruvate phosphate dikinase
LGQKIKLSDRVLAMSVFGCDVYQKYPSLFDIAQHRNSYSGPKSFSQLAMFYKSIFHVDKFLAEMVEICEKVKHQFSKEAVEKLTNSSDVFNLIERRMNYFEIVGLNHMMASNTSIIYQLFAFSILVSKSESLTTNHQSDIAAILGSISDVESANVPEMIQQIAGQIVLLNKRESFLNVESSKAVEWLKENCNEAYLTFKSFIARHGHRSLNELDFIAKPWEMQPEKIVNMIKSNLSVGVDITNASNNKSKSIDELLDNLKTPLGRISKFFLRKLLPKCQKGVQNREIAKSYLVTVVNEIRRAVTHLGSLMVHEGLLPDKDLVFHLSVNEIKDVIATRDGRLIGKATRREKMFAKWNEQKFPELSFGVPRPIVPDSIDNNNNAQAGEVLVRGVPVCGGIAIGTACVCKSFADVSKLKKGDILITYGTDIGWSPYFPILSGICTEIGEHFL